MSTIEEEKAISQDDGGISVRTIKVPSIRTPMPAAGQAKVVDAIKAVFSDGTPKGKYTTVVGMSHHYLTDEIRMGFEDVVVSQGGTLDFSDDISIACFKGEKQYSIVFAEANVTKDEPPPTEIDRLIASNVSDASSIEEAKEEDNADAASEASAASEEAKEEDNADAASEPSAASAEDAVDEAEDAPSEVNVETDAEEGEADANDSASEASTASVEDDNAVVGEAESSDSSFESIGFSGFSQECLI